MLQTVLPRAVAASPHRALMIFENRGVASPYQQTWNCCAIAVETHHVETQTRSRFVFLAIIVIFHKKSFRKVSSGIIVEITYHNASDIALYTMRYDRDLDGSLLPLIEIFRFFLAELHRKRSWNTIFHIFKYGMHNCISHVIYNIL